MMNTYHYEQDTFTIYHYDQQKSFSSFLPGIAGLHGVPIWAFYANRGQAITSFGLENKDRAILEFQPANLGYQYTHINGFRTFVKVNGEVYEPFSPANQSDDFVREMHVRRNEITIIEKNQSRQLNVEVTYYALPEENIGALVREVRVKNLATHAQSLEIIDGLAALLPTGVSHEAYKTVGNLMRSWMDVVGVETNVPLYKVRASTSDEAEVSLSSADAGNFCLSIADGQLLPVIVDPSVIFKQDTTLSIANGLKQHPVCELLKQPQATVNKVPCGMSVLTMALESQAIQQFTTLIGYTSDVTRLRQRVGEFAQAAYFETKRSRGSELIDALVAPVAMKSAYPIFDAYAKQNYLDNLLRGGEPLIFGEDEDAKVYHVFSRKHGDPERDYNFFSLAPEFYSQGNGNFRDVNQNRRNDILFQPKVANYNVKNFYDLMQLDGYNPLSVEGSTFSVTGDVEVILSECFVNGHETMRAILRHKFTPGKIVNTIASEGIQLAKSEDDVLAQILTASQQHFEASFGEGYWIDHWTYNLDLVENYCAIYPDRMQSFLFEDTSYRFFESPATVATRREKFVLTNKGVVRQYGAIIEHDEAKIERLNLQPTTANWVKTNYGQGSDYQTTLIEKLIHLATMKFLNLDPAGIGVAMEANKPGWNDAMNGLPGLFASGISESVELLRTLRFIASQLVTAQGSIAFMIEFANLFAQLPHLQAVASPMQEWELRSDWKEAYRETVRFGISGTQASVSIAEVALRIEQMIGNVETGLEQARSLGNGLLPTYVYFEATEYTQIMDERGTPVITHYGLPAVEVKAFQIHVLPHFLEAPARSLKVANYERALATYTQVKASQMYDAELGMYKTSSSLNETTFEIGRAQAFTPGWLEREAVFLHMTYKYVLGLLKAGLYEQFFNEIQTNLVCFRNPEEYGRSPLENVSFIASSVNPDPAVHGQGFVARLTGATSEYLSMWQLMMIGKKWFSFADDELTFTFAPILAADFFDEAGIVQTTLFHKTQVTYYNPTGLATFDPNVIVSHLLVDGQRVSGDTLCGAQAVALRNGEFNTVAVYFEMRGK